MKELFNQFLKEKQYLKNASPNTIAYFRHCHKALLLGLGEDLTLQGLSKASLQTFVINLREKGKGPGAINAYIRGINSFLSWLHENEHLSEHLKIKQLKREQKVMTIYPLETIKILLAWKPKNFEEHRFHTLLIFLLDTGCRIGEAFTLTRNRIDLDNFLVTVIGKGNKERIVPISVECRKYLFKFLSKHKFDLAFPTKDGGKLMYNNMRRQYLITLKKLGIEKCDGSFHSLRRLFASNFVNQDGDVLKLQRMMGHSSLHMTNKYVQIKTEVLKQVHQRTSILGQLR